MFPRPFPFRNGRFFVDKAAVGVYVIRNEGNRRIMTTPTILIDAIQPDFPCLLRHPPAEQLQGGADNAVFVFARMLLKLEKEYPSDAGALCFDCGKVQFRLELAPEYKANRRRCRRSCASRFR